MSLRPPKNSLNNLLFIVSMSIITVVAIDFINCNFKLPFSILGNQENVVSEVCKNSEKNAYDTLIILLNTVIALKTKMEE